MALYHDDGALTLYHGDAAGELDALDAESVNCVVTSPPYFGLRDYGVHGQIGLEASLDEYVNRLVAVFAAVRRVLTHDGVMWLNLGDSYSAAPSGPHGRTSATAATSSRAVSAARERIAKPSFLPHKNLLGVPWRTAFALQDDGWFLRNAVIWSKTNPMPESVRDRLSTTYEHVFLLAKSKRYRFDLDAIREPVKKPNSRAAKPDTGKVNGSVGQPDEHTSLYGTNKHQPPGTGAQRNMGPGVPHDRSHPKGKNPGDVWRLPTQPFRGAHFAPMPLRLAERCVIAGSPAGGTVLDPFAGSGTSLVAALRAGRRAVGVDLNPDFLAIARDRCDLG